MSLLDDARQLTKKEPINGADCVYCGAFLRADEDTHAPDCPWLSMPKIAAALEAASAIHEWVRADEHEYDAHGVPNHLVDDLVAALKGEVVPSV